MSNGKENSGIKNVEYYLEKSPLLRTFLDKRKAGNFDQWLDELNGQMRENVAPRIEGEFEEEWVGAVYAHNYTVWSCGLQEGTFSSEHCVYITSTLLGIRFEVGEVEGVDIVLDKVCDQLLNVNYLYKGWFNRGNTRRIASRVIRGILGTGIFFRRQLDDNGDRMRPFSDFVAGLDLSDI
jgi:hypothetical protein